MTLLTGTRLSQGCRTVAALRHSGNSMAGNWSSFHQVLNRACWPALAVSRPLLLLIAATCVPAGAPPRSKLHSSEAKNNYSRAAR